MGDLNAVTCFWFGPGPALAVVGILGSEPIDGRYLIFYCSAFQVDENKFKNKKNTKFQKHVWPQSLQTRGQGPMERLLGNCVGEMNV